MFKSTKGCKFTVPIVCKMLTVFRMPLITIVDDTFTIFTFFIVMSETTLFTIFAITKLISETYSLSHFEEMLLLWKLSSHVIWCQVVSSLVVDKRRNGLSAIFGLSATWSGCQGEVWWLYVWQVSRRDWGLDYDQLVGSHWWSLEVIGGQILVNMTVMCYILLESPRCVLCSFSRTVSHCQ